MHATEVHMVHVAKLKVVQDSYARCCAAPDFFQTFYRLLLDSSPVIPVMFGDTDFERQERLVKHGIALLLLYAKRGNPVLLERIAIRHGRLASRSRRARTSLLTA